MDSIEDFIKTFEKLEGITLDEKERNFRKLLHKNSSLLEDQTSNGIIISRLAPKSHLENLFRVDLLLACKRTPELLDVFTNGSEVLISRIIKHSWFFREAFHDMTGQEIADDILPQLSLSIRMKVLKKLCIFLNDQDRLCEVFDAVKSKYGLKVAMPLLLGCGYDKIEFVIRNNPVFFSNCQLRHFIKKMPKLLPLYVEEYIKHKGNHRFLVSGEICRLIASVDYDVYCDLAKKYCLYPSYGRRITKKIFEKEKDIILAEPKKFQNVFNRAAFVRKLGEHGSFKSYFLTLFPDEVKNFNFTDQFFLHCRLRHYPKSKQFQLLEESFEKVYKLPISSYPKGITTTLLNIINDSNKKEQIVEKIIEGNNDVGFIVYQDTSKSIPYIKKEITLAANKFGRRTELIEALVKTCNLNNDTTALKEVIKYVLAHLRNDIDVLSTFLACLEKFYDFHTFQKETWDLVKELIEILKVKGRDKYSIDDILFTYVEFVYKNGKPIEESLQEAMKYSSSPYIFIFSHKCSNNEFRRIAMIKTISLLPKVVCEKDLQNSYCQLAANVISWNKNHPAYSVSTSEYPILLESLKENARIKIYHSIEPLLCSKDRSDQIIEITELYWDRYLTSNLKVVSYFMEWYPTIFVNHIEYSTGALIKYHSGSNKIFRRIKKYEHIELPQNIIKSIQNRLDQMKNDEQSGDEDIVPITKSTFTVLSRLMHPEDYINYIEKYKPNNLSVDMTGEKEKELYQIQCYAITNLRYILSPIVLPHILSYSGGDFLKSILAPLYKAFQHIPENKLHPFLDQLSKKSVSVRKHAVFLALQICDLDSIKNFFKLVSSVEKNISLQKRFMLTTLKLCQQHESDDFWDIFIYSLNFIEETDVEAFETLISTSYIPRNYRTRYFKEIWSQIEKHNLLQTHKYELRRKFASRIEPYFDQFPSDFCCEVIDNLFLKFDDKIDYERRTINKLIYQFLLNNHGSDRFTKILKILEDAKDYSSNTPELKALVRKEIRVFIDKFFNFFVSNCEYLDKASLKEFLTNLSGMYPDVEFFNTRMLISISFILLNLPENDIKLYAIELSRFNEEMVATCGPYVVDLLEFPVKKSLEYFEDLDDESLLTLKFIEALLNTGTLEHSYQLALKLFKYCNKSSPGYERIVNIFKSCKYPYIRIIFEKKFPHDVVCTI